MKLDYHDLSEDQFERLVIAVCTWLLGPAVQDFSKGPDGGKDARFHGRAERFPSAAGPWDGRIIIQAKHTDLINRKFSEPGFSGDAKSSVLSKEIPKIQRLRDAGELDYYMLFSNRRLAGVAEEEIRKWIAQAAGIDESAVYLGGEEELDKYLTWQPDIQRRAGINLFDVQPFIDPGDLARVIEGFAEARSCLSNSPHGDRPPPEQRVPFKDKNRINGLSSDYAGRIENYIKEFSSVETFLAAPENDRYLGWYKDTVEDLEGLILSQRRADQPFDQMLEGIFTRLINRDYDLKTNKRLTRTVLYTRCT